MRLFVALELPEEVRAALAASGAALAARDRALRAMRADSLHVTLCFLGERRDGEEEAIAGVVRAVCGPAPQLAVDAPLLLPPRRPRVVAVRLAEAGETLAGLQASLADSLVALGVYAREARPFLPHVTLARVRRGARALPLPDAIAHPAGAFVAREVVLFRSRPGSVYEPLARATLRA